LGVVALVLVLAGIAAELAKYFFGPGEVFGPDHLFNLNEEANVPALFSTLLLFFAASLLALITVTARRHKAADVSKWMVLTCVLVIATIDEAVSLHEDLGGVVRGLQGEGPYGVFYWGWVIPGIAVVIVLAAFFSRFLWRLPKRTRLAFLAAAMIYAGGALGLELVGGYYAEVRGTADLAVRLIGDVEEALEMAGVIVFIQALLEYIADRYGEVRFRLSPSEGDSGSDAP
jgi:predicted permease